MTVADTAVQFDIPMERPLYTPALKPVIANIEIESGDEDLDASTLYSQVMIDKTKLARHVRQCLQDHTQISLKELVDRAPLTQGLAELISYLQLGDDQFKTVVLEEHSESISWTLFDADQVIRHKRATMPKVVFLR
jgi:hypothetical protein